MSKGSIALELNGFEELATLWRQAPEIVHREMMAAAEESLALLQNQVVERTPRGASSTLGSSILAETVTFFEGNILGLVGTSLSYAVPVELGTDPHFPWDKSTKSVPDSLVEWVEHKLGYTDKKAVSVAYAIATKISRKGTKGKFMFRDGFAASEPLIKARFTQAMEQIKQELADI